MRIQNTKQLHGAYETWKHSHTTSLDMAYGSYSNRKARAWDYCLDLMQKYNGYSIRILGHNCMTFSVGFVGYIDGLKHFFYITRDYDRALPLEKMDPVTGEVLEA